MYQQLSSTGHMDYGAGTTWVCFGPLFFPIVHCRTVSLDHDLYPVGCRHFHMLMTHKFT